MRKTRMIIFKICGCFLLLVIGLLLLLSSKEEVDTNAKMMIIERAIRSPTNQGQCRMPHLPIDNPEIMKYYQSVAPIDCGDILDDWVMCEKSICFVKPEINANHGEVTCSYTDIIRITDEFISYGKTTKTKEPYLLLKSDFAKVACRAESGQRWVGIVYGIRDAVERKYQPPSLNSFRSSYSEHNLDTTPSYFNVLIYGFDSLSRNAFIRKLPKSYAYLTEKLGAVVLKGYNIVGDGTPQALVPLLTGYTELELPETRKRMHNSQKVDVYPMIWNDYAQHGYYTSFNEDLPNVGTFTYRLNGFLKQPVDHYLRTFYYQSSESWSWNKEHCIGHQPDHMVMLQYTKDFMIKYSEAPRFVFSFHGGLSHDSINLVGAADDDVVDWLQSLKNERLLDKTILIFMADHGSRFSEVRATLQGKQEERLPFFSFTFPDAFKTKFPQKYQNFVQNAEILTTPFDIHATLKDILNIQNEAQPDDASAVPKHEKRMPMHIYQLAKTRAISLFDLIPKNRSCADAYIEPHWCSCLHWQQLNLNNLEHNAILNKASASIVESLNNATSDYRTVCAVLELHSINWAMRLRPHKDLLHYKGVSDRDGFLADMTDDMQQHENIYQLQIVVNPGKSIFEATVLVDLSTFSIHTRLSDVSRINRYGEQANCIYDRNPELRKFCYCRTRS